MPNSLPTSVRPAAAAILVRERNNKPELLMVKKHAALNYGNSWVFPGGLCESSDGNEEIPRAITAATRETREETGLDIANLAINPYSHWVTPEGIAKRYAAWFFIVNADRLLTPVRIDQQEIVDSAWISPSEALRRHAEGQMQLNGPAFVSLSELADYPRLDELLDSTTKAKPVIYKPRGFKHHNGFIALYHDDPLYHSDLPLSLKLIDATPVAQRHRLYMNSNRPWDYYAGPTRS